MQSYVRTKRTTNFGAPFRRLKRIFQANHDVVRKSLGLPRLLRGHQGSPSDCLPTPPGVCRPHAPPSLVTYDRSAGREPLPASCDTLVRLPNLLLLRKRRSLTMQGSCVEPEIFMAPSTIALRSGGAPLVVAQESHPPVILVKSRYKGPYMEGLNKVRGDGSVKRRRGLETGCDS